MSETAIVVCKPEIREYLKFAVQEEVLGPHDDETKHRKVDLKVGIDTEKDIIQVSIGQFSGVDIPRRAGKTLISMLEDIERRACERSGPLPALPVVEETIDILLKTDHQPTQ